MKSVRLFVAVVVLLTLSACTPARSIDTAALQSQVRVITDYRDTPAVPWSSDELTAFDSYCLPFPTEIQNWEQLVCAPAEPRESLTYLEADEEVRLFFQILKEAYAGYDYFGGEPAFSEARQHIQDLVRTECQGNQRISARKLRKSLLNELAPIIQDGHFTIGNHRLNFDSYAMYYVPDLYLDTIDSVVPEMQKYVRPVLSHDGELKLGFVVCDTSADGLPSTAVVGNQTVELNWCGAIPCDDKRGILNSPFLVREVDQIPVLTMRSFDPSVLTDKNLNKMLDSSVKYRGEPIIILDIRGNTGGYSDIPELWLKQFLDSETTIGEKTVAGIKCSGLWVHETIAYFGEEAAAEAQSYHGSWNIGVYPESSVKNDCIIFVLVDKHTASAAEDFVHYLRAVPNAVIIGSNTSGTKIFGNVRTVYLPYSGIKVRFGTSLAFRGTLENTDGIGISPDLWVPPDFALESVLSFIEKYEGQ